MSEGDNYSEGSLVPVVSRSLGPGNRIFLEVTSMVVTWWIVAFLHSNIPCPERHHLTKLEITRSDTKQQYACAMGSQPGDCKWPIKYSSGVCVGMYFTLTIPRVLIVTEKF